MRQKINTIAVAAVVSALAVAGLAVAQGDDNGAGNGKSRAGERPPGPPPGDAGLMLGRDLTYSETHLREDDEDVTVRTDKGKLTARDDDSVTIERNDGETLDLPVDDDTRVMAGPRRHGADIADIAVGKTVIVIRKSGSDAAEAVGVLPKHPLRMRFRHREHDGDFGPEAMPLPRPDGVQG